jgi:dipeptidyl aminopeptidase/acylaminoacyl peptidase
MFAAVSVGGTSVRTHVALIIIAVAATARAAEHTASATHPFNVNDLIAMDRLSDPAVSPDGRRVVFTVSALDADATKRRKDLYVASVDGSGEARALTSSGKDDAAAWSPDGAWIYFLSSRGGSSQVWRLPVMGGGEAQVVTHLPVDVSGFLLSPDGARLVVSLDVFPACADLACTQKRLAEQSARKSSGQLYDKLFMRHWDAWSDGRRSHLFALPSTGGATEAVDLMKGMDADCPSKPFGDAADYTFTPDGKSIVFSARDAGRTEPWSMNFDLYLVPVDGTAAPRDLTASNQAWDGAPLVSRDGKTLVHLAMARPGYESDRHHVMVRRFPDGADREVAAAWDRSPDEIALAPDGRTLYGTADNLGHKALFAIDLESGRVRSIVAEGHAASPRLAGDRVVFLLDHLRSPAELHSVRLDGGDLRAMTRLNSARLASIRFGQPEQLAFKGARGDLVHAWIVKPVDLDAKKKYPIALLIHGGPQGSFANDFHYRWNPEIYAGAGYAAIMIDFHGSTGYGQAFTDAINGDWGGKPLVDLQKGLAAAIEKYEFLDGDRACALGASYGGWMINWIAGNWPNRFRCLVSHDGNLDERMAYYDTEELWFPEWEHKGTPWENPAGYVKQNPIDYVKNWRTPMLVVHGGRDYRVVDSQGMGVFTALQRRGIPSRFLYFPDENHWVLKPQNSVLWHQTVLDWLERWTKPAVVNAAP